MTPPFSSRSAPPSVIALCRDVLPGMIRALDPDRLLKDVETLVATERWNSFDRFHETTRTIVDGFRNAGARADVFRVWTGGPAGDGRWRIQSAVDVRTAGVEVVAPVRERIADYQDNPWTVVQWAAATPPEGVEGDLVIVDSLRDLDRMPRGRMRGRVVLTRTSLYHKFSCWTAHGVRAVISDAPAEGLPEATRWSKLGWGGVEIEHAAERPVALALSAAAGARLRALAAEHGVVRVRVWNDVHFYQGTHDVVSGVIPGAADPQDEVWAIAHSSEPGAVDNASGVAACIGAARLLEELFRKGALPRPKRTIRFLTGFECYGFFPYFLETPRLQPPLAGLVVDCVGVRADACDGTLPWHTSAPGSADFVDAAGYPLLDAALAAVDAGVRPAFKPFVSTEDTLLGDPGYGFPCPYLGTYPYRGYHTSADTIDLIDPDVLKAAVAVTAAYLWFLADADSRHVAELSTWTTDHVYVPAVRAAESAEQRRLQQVRADATLRRIQRWLWGGDRAELPADLAACSRKIADAVSQGQGPETPACRSEASAVPVAGAVPFRRAALAPTYENVWPDARERFMNTGIPKWALYFADGDRTLADLQTLISAACGKAYTIEQVHEFFSAMHDIGYVELVPANELITRERLVEDLRRLGLRPGMDVMVHSSLSRIGWVKGGAETVVDALLEVLGPESTLLMPSFNHRAAEVYNPMTTPTINGAIPDAFWRRPGVVRSLHPTHAVAALGPKAEEWLRGHVEVGIWAADSPIGRLIHSGGWILGLGVDHTTSTAYHVGEVSLNVPCLDQFSAVGKIVDRDGRVRTVPSLAWRNAPCPVSPSRITEELDRRGVQRRGKVGQADCVFCRAIEVWRVRREQIRKVCPTCPVRPRADTPPPRLKPPPG